MSISTSEPKRPRIAILSGPMGTIENTAPLVTGNKARLRYGLAAQPGRRFEALRPQRLAAPVTVYVEQFSAHPLERDAAALYAPPDGFVDRRGRFRAERRSPADIPVYAMELHPDDGLYPLPYAGRQADGNAWDDVCTRPGAPVEGCRQTFYPDASRLVEEIDRLGLGPDGQVGALSARAEFSFHRVAPSGGYRAGLAATSRTDAGKGDISSEELGRDYFPYLPPHLLREPSSAILAGLTDRAAAALDEPGLAGAVILDASTGLEETAYWLSLLLDTPLPVVATCSPDAPHGVVGAIGDRNLMDAVEYITAGAWADDQGRDRVGVVVVSAGLLIAARDAHKTDARPGGIVGLGGSGVIGNLARPGRPHLTYIPARRATHRSEVRLTCIPSTVSGVAWAAGGARTLQAVSVEVRDPAGRLLPGAMPQVAIVSHGRFRTADDAGVAAQVAAFLATAPLAGFVAAGSTPYGRLDPPVDAALTQAAFSGQVVARVGHGDSEGFVTPDTVRNAIAGGDLSPTKARLLLMACLLRFGAPPPAADPPHPTPDERQAVTAHLAQFQEVFDQH
ncbi:MAG: asparaginase domain-containing protein [Candidatus Limnocylindrales bacterium]